jgi:metal-responsive CopG/Arc/MetJ family transcriptional regulator
MKQLHVWVEDDTAKELEKYPNKSEVIRKAIIMYNGHITTDTLHGMRAAFLKLSKQYEEMEARFIEQYELVERLARMIEELSNR